MEDRRALEDLLIRCALRDQQAFADLYDRTSAKLFGITLRVLKNRSTAEDAVQEAYMKIWTHADRFRPGPQSPMTWLITIARNTAIDRLRASGRDQATDVLDLTLASKAPGPERQAVAASDAARLLACFDTLPQDRAEAVRAVYLHGASYADLAERFGHPLNTIRTWLRRGLIALRECMADG